MTEKPQFALIVDVRGWAFDNIASHIVANFSSVYEFKVFYAGDYTEDWSALFADVFLEFCADHVHFFWREQIFNLLKNPRRFARYLNDKEIDPADFATAYARAVITTTIYDHLNSDLDALQMRSPLMNYLDGYSVASPKLESIYRGSFVHAPDCITEDGVDRKLFKPAGLERFSNHDRPLVVGWAGNSEWGTQHGEDFKGFHSIIVPAVKKLQSRGATMIGHYADRKDRWRDRTEMVQYYSEIDVLVCMSTHEGTPNPVLEAMACGVPVISTDVGIVSMVCQGIAASCVLSERSQEALEEALSLLDEDRGFLAAMSAENLVCIRDWQWKHKMAKWERLFSSAAERHRQHSVYRHQQVQQLFTLACGFEKFHGLASVRKVRIDELRVGLREQRSKCQHSSAEVRQLERKVNSLEKSNSTLRTAVDKNRKARINMEKKLEQIHSAGLSRKKAS